MRVSGRRPFGTKRLPREALEAMIALFALAHVHVDGKTHRHGWGPTLAPAEQHGLTLSDAAYLEPALRRCLPLASLNANLRATAAAQGVICLPA